MLQTRFSKRLKTTPNPLDLSPPLVHPPGYIPASGRILSALLAFAVIATGCVTPRSTSPTAGFAESSSDVIDERTARKEVEYARRLIEDGNYFPVIPRLQHTISKYPSSQAAIDARYYLGLTFYNIEGYRDAIDMFAEYLEKAPEGPFARDSKAYIDQLTEEYERRFPSPTRLDNAIVNARDAVAEAPQSVDKHAELADLLWRRGNYDEAAALYMDILGQHPEFAQDETFLSRVELLPNNEYVVLSPAETIRREAEAQPLTIRNANSFHTGRDPLTRTPMYYAVAGQAYNRSDSVLYGVTVQVTIYSYSNTVYDTATYNIGRLNPGESRAFSVRLSNFDNIDNISRFECVGNFQR